MDNSSTPILFSFLSLMVSGFIGPTAVVLFTYFMRRRERAEAEERRREEEEHRLEIAAEAKKMATKMVQQSAELTRETRREIERLTNRTVETIADMKNGNLLEAERRELEANRLALQTMREAVAMKEAHGADVLPETWVAMDRLAVQVRALDAAIRVKERRLAADGNEHH